MKIPSREVIGIFFFVIFNVCLFIYANNIPIYWQQGEITLHRFFWSAQNENDWTLHTGLNREDWTKPFYARRVDSDFRPRQLSYLFEILSFKFWQSLGVLLIRDYTIIGLHLMNVILLAVLIFGLTRNKSTMFLGAMLFLNSGIALATLLFPFRPAKLLIVTFLLLALMIIVRTPGHFFQANLKRLALFFGVLLLASFTDEYIIFVVLVLTIYLCCKEGVGSTFHPRLLTGFTFLIILVAGGVYGALGLVRHFDGYPFGMSLQTDYLRMYGSYLAHPWKVISDVSRSLGQYFFPRIFGYWDVTVLGLGSFFSFVWFLRSALVHRAENFLIRFSLALVFGVLFFTVFLPNNCGVHAVFMPPDTFFPSLLYFSYYYPYFHSLLICLAVALSLNRYLLKRSSVFTSFVLVTFMSISNVAHLQHGPRDALVFHGWHYPPLQTMMQSIVMASQESRQTKNQPIYLSFPSGEGTLSFLKREPSQQRFDCLYASVISVSLLKLIEQGKVIISLNNVRLPGIAKGDSGSEIFKAHWFLDVPTMRKWNLRGLKGFRGSEAMQNVLFQQEGIFSFPLAEQGKKLLFFVKGKSEVSFELGRIHHHGEQFYGDSYQLFSVLIPQDIHAGTTMEIGIKSTGQSDVSLVGPYVSDE